MEAFEVTWGPDDTTDLGLVIGDSASQALAEFLTVFLAVVVWRAKLAREGFAFQVRSGAFQNTGPACVHIHLIFQSGSAEKGPLSHRVSECLKVESNVVGQRRHELSTMTADICTNCLRPNVRNPPATALLATEAEYMTECTQSVQLVLGSPTGCEAIVLTARRCLRCVLPLHSERFQSKTPLFVCLRIFLGRRRRSLNWGIESHRDG